MYSGTGVCAGQAYWQSTTLWKYSGSFMFVGPNFPNCLKKPRKLRRFYKRNKPKKKSWAFYDINLRISDNKVYFASKFTKFMATVEQVKASINGLSVSDQSDVLLHILRLKYRAKVEEISKLSGASAQYEMIDDLSYDELLERLNLLEGIAHGLPQASAGNSISHEALKKRFEQWQQQR
jgi:hypothetical protein